MAKTARRNNQINIKLSDAEMEFLRGEAERYGVAVTELVRDYVKERHRNSTSKDEQ